MSINPVKVMKALAADYCDKVMNITRESADLASATADCDDENDAQAIYHTALLVACLPNFVARVESLSYKLQTAQLEGDEDEVFRKLMQTVLIENLNEIAMLHTFIDAMMTQFEGLAEVKPAFKTIGIKELRKVHRELNELMDVMEADDEEEE